MWQRPEALIGSMSIALIGSRATMQAQVLLVEELTGRGVEVIFLNRPLGETPEDQLLLQVEAGDCRIRAGEIPRTQSARQTACCPRRASWYSLSRSLWVSV